MKSLSQITYINWHSQFVNKYWFYQSKRIPYFDMHCDQAIFEAIHISNGLHSIICIKLFLHKQRLHCILLLVRTIFIFLGKIDLTLRSPVQCAPNNCLPTCHGCGRDTGRLFNYPTKWRLSTAGHSQCFYFSILST